MAKARTTKGKTLTELQSINKRIQSATTDVAQGKKGARGRLSKAITAKAKYYEKKGKASCKARTRK